MPRQERAQRRDYAPSVKARPVPKQVPAPQTPTRPPHTPRVQPRPQPQAPPVPTNQRGRFPYAPSVRPRGIRADGLPQYTPQYPQPLTPQIRVLLINNGAIVGELIPAVVTRRIRIIRIKVIQFATEGQRLCEFYFGSQANIDSAQTNGDQLIDILRIPDLGEDTTRTYAIGQGPVGERNQVVAYRFTTAPSSSNHRAIIEYTEEP